MSATHRKARRIATRAVSTACTLFVGLAITPALHACSSATPRPRPTLTGEARTAEAADPARTPFHGWESVDRAVAAGAIEHLVVATPIESIGNRFRTYRLLGPQNQPGELLVERTDDGLRLTLLLGRFGLPDLEADVLESVQRELRNAR